MSEIKRRKFNKIMDHRDQIERTATQAISQLAASVGQAVDFTILLEEDPSNQFTTNGDKGEIQQDFADSLASLDAVLPTLELIRQMKDSEITISQFKTSVSKTDFDTVEYEKSIGG